MNISLVRIALMSMLFGLSGTGLCLAQVMTPVASEGDIEFENIKLPPRDIRDILSILNTTKQDTVLVDKAKKILTIPVPDSKDSETLNHYYYRQATAQQILENPTAVVMNLKKVLFEYPSKDIELQIDENQAYANAERELGNLLVARKIYEGNISKLPIARNEGTILSQHRNIAGICAQMGDFDCVKSSLNEIEVIIYQTRGFRNVNPIRQANWEAGYESTRARLFVMESNYIEAERSYAKALKLNQQVLDGNKSSGKDALDIERRVVQDSTTNQSDFYLTKIGMQKRIALSFLKQKKLVDAEYWGREALILSINRTGVNSSITSTCLNTLARIISEQGRQPEAVLLANAALVSAEKSTNFPGSVVIAESRSTLAAVLVADKNYAEADKVYDQMATGLNANPEIAARFDKNNIDWVFALLKTNKVARATQMTDSLLKQAVSRMDKNSPNLAMSRAFYASALLADGKSSSAMAEFKQSIPILIDQAQNDAENSTGSLTQTQRLNFVLSNYLGLLAQIAKSNPSQSVVAATEAFQIADVARGSGVQRALTESAARAAIREPQLASLARQEQDLQRRVNTLSDLLTGLLSAPTSQQLPVVQAKIKSDINIFKAERDKIKKEIEKKFPEYAELVDPKPATIERTQKLLRPDEVLVSWYFSDNVSYVWAISKDAPVQFAQLPIGRSQIAKEVAQLRKSLDPGVLTIDEIPAFDVVIANQLYQQILAPVESALKGKKVMIAVPHADLGQLPLSVLVTKATTQPVKAGTPFASYKTVPFLTKDIAIAQIPSVTALTALRSLPEGDPNRKSFVGFGDPYFSALQEKQADKTIGTQLATRGIPLSLRSAPKTSGVSSAELALLPRLPDTSLELEDIGKVVGAGPGDIFLHKQASVKQVMSMDLSNRKVVMFSTHGLVPGDLNGLTQPALALSSPDVTGDRDDGLLTMDKVIGLKLNADWVVLSACNTAAGEGAASEAVSGLGRAFFFAGTRALLVSNWPVDSVASRQLMTDLFKRQQDNKTLVKPEALRQAMLAQIDQGGVKDGNTMKYSYAHPLFWAPFMVVGD